LANRQVTVLYSKGGQTPLREDLTYNGLSQVKMMTRFNGLDGTPAQKVGSSAYGYDEAARLQNLQHQTGAGATLANYPYTYDLADRLLSEQRNGGPPTA